MYCGLLGNIIDNADRKEVPIYVCLRTFKKKNELPVSIISQSCITKNNIITTILPFHVGLLAHVGLIAGDNLILINKSWWRLGSYFCRKWALRPDQLTCSLAITVRLYKGKDHCQYPWCWFKLDSVHFSSGWEIYIAKCIINFSMCCRRPLQLSSSFSNANLALAYG